MIVQSYDLMRLPPRDATAEGDLTIPFQQSALKSTADQDPFFQHLKIRYVKASDSSDSAQVGPTSNSGPGQQLTLFHIGCVCTARYLVSGLQTALTRLRGQNSSVWCKSSVLSHQCTSHTPPACCSMACSAHRFTPL